MEKKIKEISGSQEKDDETLIDEIRSSAAGLFYISESDNPLEVFSGGRADTVNYKEILKQTGKDEREPIEEIPFDDFFDRLTEIKGWYGENEKANAHRYAALRDLLRSNLKDLKVFRVGKIQIEIYVVGVTEKQILTGIKTKSIET